MANEDSTVQHPSAAADAIDWPAEFARHGRWLRTVAAARVGEWTAVDDLLQEVSLTAIQKGAQLRDPRRVAAWLYRLVVVAALQYRRRQGRRRKHIERYANQPPLADDTPTTPLGWLLADERKTLVHRALALLPPRDAEIMLLKYTEDWSYQQLADHLGLSTSAVEARLHRARHKLRKALYKFDPSLISS